MTLKVDVEKKLKGFSLKVAFDTEGLRHGILGASGCGKSMTLKMIAGIEKPDRGRITVDGRVLYDSETGVNLSPQERRVGYLFQNYALFPHMTVVENIGAGLPRGKERDTIVGHMLSSLHLEDLGHRYPSQLSGGQQQRVALARCLAYKPSILMLDEPFSALDEYLKEQLQREVKQALEGYEGHIILVTHNRDEVYRFCQRISVLDRGALVADGPVKQVFEHPRHVTAAKLSGCKNISPITILQGGKFHCKEWGIDLETTREVGDNVDHVGIRAHHIKMVEQEGPNQVKAIVKEVQRDLFEVNVMVATHKGHLWWKIPENQFATLESKLKVGNDIVIQLPGEKLLLLQGGINETN